MALKPLTIAGHGISIELPAGWEGLIYRRKDAHPILHAGSFALPQGDGDFGTGAIDAMGPGDVFVALLEYDGELSGFGLFGTQGIPIPVKTGELSPRAFPRIVRGRVAVQKFFTEQDRAFCLYLVASALDGLPPRAGVRSANRILRTLRIDAGDAA
jgi:hypothetical protein